MSPKLYRWLRAIKEVEREYGATQLATQRLLYDSHRDPTILHGELAVRDVGHAAERLEGTYLIRLFAKFEGGLRLFWSVSLETYPPMRDLLDGVTAMRRIPHEYLKQAYRVREYRNSLVHEPTGDAGSISIAEARGHLCRYFAFLPPNW
ncbi:MAG: hypothetical protein WD872_18905 [Pirellulaceae bacterium]